MARREGPKNDFDYPNNVKQIGGIDYSVRIYMEDYVHSYLMQFSSKKPLSDKIAILCGRYYKKDGIQILMIEGAIQGRYSQKERGMEVFSDESLSYVDKQMNQFFPNAEILGWMYAQPDFGGKLSPAISMYHKEKFALPYHICYILDVNDNLGSFYVYDKKRQLRETAGYFIYFDKNQDMQNYMVENRVISIPLVDYEQKEEVKIVENKRRKQIEKPDEKKVMNETKRIVQMVGSMSALLLLLVFVMGVSLLQSRDKLTKLESELGLLSKGYKNISAQLSDRNVRQVFAQSGVKEEKGASLIDASGKLVKVELKTLSELEQNVNEMTETIAEDAMTEVTTEDVIQANKDTTYKEYVIQEGDSLLGISLKFYKSKDMVEEIMKLNNMSDPNRIKFGKKILLP